MEVSRNIAHKLISIAAGEAHTLAVSGDGKVYSWGRGTFGRLGTGSENDEPVPVQAKLGFNGEEPNIVGVSAGAYHSLALADNGSVWSWGYNTYGQLGVSGGNSLDPLLVEGFLELGSPANITDAPDIKNNKSLKVSYVKAGGMMSLAIDHLGTLWIWGNCPPQPNSTDVEFNLIATSTPSPIWSFYGHTVVKVSCGNEHVVALVSAGEKYEQDNNVICYSWGGNKHGQLGLGDNKSRCEPQMIEAFSLESPFAVYEVACGAFHTAILARRKNPSSDSETSCWTFGLGDNGQTGQGTTKTLFSPKTVEGLPTNAYLVSVDCGLFHTSVILSTGEVFSWGMEKGLGLCPDASFTGNDAGDAILPLLYVPNGHQGSRFHDPVQVTCGAAHTVIVADSGYKIWSWGRGRSGVLGNGKTLDCFVPNLVLWPPLSEILKDDIAKEKGEEVGEMEKRLAVAESENEGLRLKLERMQRYASILHGAVFGEQFEEKDIISLSLKKAADSFDVGKEWEELLESSDRGKLRRLEMFYGRMIDEVRDKMMKKRIKEIIMECMNSSSTSTYQN